MSRSRRWSGYKIPSINDEAFLDDGIVDTYIEMCGRYVNGIRESWRASGREFVGWDEAESIEWKSVEVQSPGSIAGGRKHVIVIPYKKFEEFVDAVELGDPG